MHGRRSGKCKRESLRDPLLPFYSPSLLPSHLPPPPPSLPAWSQVCKRWLQFVGNRVANSWQMMNNLTFAVQRCNSATQSYPEFVVYILFTSFYAGRFAAGLRSSYWLSVIPNQLPWWCPITLLWLGSRVTDSYRLSSNVIELFFSSVIVSFHAPPFSFPLETVCTREALRGCVYHVVRNVQFLKAFCNSFRNALSTSSHHHIKYVVSLQPSSY